MSQWSPLLSGREKEKYKSLMKKSMRALRTEAKEADLCAGAKTKAKLAYDMVKEKRPHERTSSNPFVQRSERKNRNKRKETPYSRPRGVANHPQQSKISPVEWLADADRVTDTSMDALNRPGSAYQVDKLHCASTPTVDYTSGNAHRDELVMSDRLASPGCTLHLDSTTTPRDLERKRDGEAQAHPKQRPRHSLLQNLDQGSSEPTSGSACSDEAGRPCFLGYPWLTRVLYHPSRADEEQAHPRQRPRHSLLHEPTSSSKCSDEAGRSCSIGYSRLPPVFYYPSAPFSIRSPSPGSATYDSVQPQPPTTEPFPSFCLIPLPHSSPPPEPLGERKLPPIREVFPFVSWPLRPEAMPLSA